MTDSLRDFAEKLNLMSAGKTAHTWYLQSPYRKKYLIVSIEHDYFVVKFIDKSIFGFLANQRFKKFLNNEGVSDSLVKSKNIIECRIFEKKKTVETMAFVRRCFEHVHKLKGEFPLQFTGINI